MTTRAPDGRSTRWDTHRRERRRAIIAAAVLAIEAAGPDALTEQIARQAGVPRTHLYRQFQDRSALDLAVGAQVAADLGARLRAGLAASGTPRGIIGAAVAAHLSWIEEHPNLYRFLARHAYAIRDDTGVSDAKAVFAAELTAVLARYLRLLGADPAPAERVIVGVVGMVDATATWWLERRDVPRAELTDTLTRQVWLLVEDTTRGLGIRLRPDQQLPG